ncbi:Uncharacterised protein [Chlamydia trachomatis]|nr:Uncharacterised protein [Chlamydia trachomatis]
MSSSFSCVLSSCVFSCFCLESSSLTTCLASSGCASAFESKVVEFEENASFLLLFSKIFCYSCSSISFSCNLKTASKIICFLNSGSKYLFIFKVEPSLSV